jgi:hypothetical protein
VVKFHSLFSKAIYEHMFYTPTLKCVPNVMDDHTREPKRQNQMIRLKVRVISCMLSFLNICKCKMLILEESNAICNL